MIKIGEMMMTLDLHRQGLVRQPLELGYTRSHGI